MENIEEARKLILEGCRRAKILEESLLNMATQQLQPDHLLSSCTEIVKFFSNATESISKELQAMELFRAQLLLGTAPPPSLFPVNAKAKGVVIRDQESEAAVAAAPKRSLGSGGDQVGVEVVAASPSGPRGSSSQRKRRRSDGDTGTVVRVAAPQMGNTDVPPEDGYTWRKYGQKAIQYAQHPRSYFRCTHQKLYNCPAKKQVQRLDDDPTVFEVTYLGDHTCHLSSTAPSGQPPQSSHPHQVMPQPQDTQRQITTATTASVPLNFHLVPTPFQWFTEINTTRGPNPGDVGGHMWPSNTYINALASGPAAAADVAGPSTSRTPYVREHQQQEVEYNQQQPVADMADAMFKSGSSSNSMDLIFFPKEDKWDSGVKKN